MAGTIEVERIANDCGKNSEMSITVTDITGNTIQKSVGNGSTISIPVEDGEYTVVVKLGVKSNVVKVTVASNTIKLQATVIPQSNATIGIARIELT
jgi:hypothetical protein